MKFFATKNNFWAEIFSAKCHILEVKTYHNENDNFEVNDKHLEYYRHYLKILKIITNRLYEFLITCLSYWQ